MRNALAWQTTFFFLMLFGALLALILAASEYFTQRWQNEQRQRTLSQAEAQVQSLLAERRQLLFQQVQMVAQKPQILNLVQEGNINALWQESQRLQKQLNWSIFDIIDEEGHLLVSVKENFTAEAAVQSAAIITQAKRGQTILNTFWRQKRLMWLVAAPLGDSVNPQGVLLGGIFLGQELLNPLHQLTQAEVSLLHAGQVIESTGGTKQRETVIELLKAVQLQGAIPPSGLIFQQAEHWLQLLPLTPESSVQEAALVFNWQKETLPQPQLRWLILGLGFLGMVAILGFSYWLAQTHREAWEALQQRLSAFMQEANGLTLAAPKEDPQDTCWKTLEAMQEWLRQHTKNLHWLEQAIQSLNQASPETKSILNQAIQLLVKRFQMEWNVGYLVLRDSQLDRQAQQIPIGAASNSLQALRLCDELSAQAAAQSQLIFYPDLTGLLAKAGALENLPIQTALALPLVVEKQVLGVLVMAGYSGKITLDHGLENILKQFGAWVAITLQRQPFPALNTSDSIASEEPLAMPETQASLAAFMQENSDLRFQLYEQTAELQALRQQLQDLAPSPLPALDVLDEARLFRAWLEATPQGFWRFGEEGRVRGTPSAICRKWWGRSLEGAEVLPLLGSGQNSVVQRAVLAFFQNQVTWETLRLQLPERLHVGQTHLKLQYACLPAEFPGASPEILVMARDATAEHQFRQQAQTWQDRYWQLWEMGQDRLGFQEARQQCTLDLQKFVSLLNQSSGHWDWSELRRLYGSLGRIFRRYHLRNAEALWQALGQPLEQHFGQTIAFESSLLKLLRQQTQALQETVIHALNELAQSLPEPWGASLQAIRQEIKLTVPPSEQNTENSTEWLTLRQAIHELWAQPTGPVLRKQDKLYRIPESKIEKINELLQQWESHFSKRTLPVPSRATPEILLGEVLMSQKAFAEGLAKAWHKTLKLEIQGENLKISPILGEKVGLILRQWLREMVTYSLESGEVRRSKKLEPCGKILLGASSEGSKLVLSMNEDGGGFQTEALERSKQKLAKEEREGLDWLFHPDLAWEHSLLFPPNPFYEWKQKVVALGGTIVWHPLASQGSEWKIFLPGELKITPKTSMDLEIIEHMAAYVP